HRRTAHPAAARPARARAPLRALRRREAAALGRDRARHRAARPAARRAHLRAGRAHLARARRAARRAARRRALRRRRHPRPGPRPRTRRARVRARGAARDRDTESRMTELLAPVTGDRVVHRINPVAKIAASAAIGVALISTIDWVSGAVALALVCALIPFAGVPWRALLVRVAPLVVAAPLTALTLALYGAPSGEVYGSFLLATVSEGSVQLAAAAALRVLAIGLPAVLLVATVDTTDLADGLIQTWRLPARFV